MSQEPGIQPPLPQPKRPFLLDWIVTEWKEVKKVPVSLAFFVILGCVLTFTFVQLINKGTIETQKATIDGQDKEIKRLKERPEQMDFSQMFMSEPLTNLVNGERIVLKYEPIPSTIRLAAPNYTPMEFKAQAFGTLEGKVIWVREDERRDVVAFANHGGYVEYVRKSLKE